MENDAQELLERHRAFWHREKTDRALLTVARPVPLAPTPLPLRDGSSDCDVRLSPDMLDPRAFSALKYRGQGNGHLVLGGSFAVRNPYGRIPWVEAILGCPVWAGQKSSGSIWSEPFLASPGELGKLDRSPDNPWLRELLEFTRYLVSENDGSYLVAHALMRGPIDLAAAVLGQSEMCLAIYDDRAELTNLLAVLTARFVEIAEAQQRVIPAFHGGYCTRYGIWAPGTVGYTQCDASALLSPRIYAELVFPFDQAICRHFEYSLIHLHSGFLHTVDALLDAEYPTAIQIALDTGSTPVGTREIVPTCRKILQRKPLIIEGNMRASDLEYLLDNLLPHGLYVSAWLGEN